MASMYKGGIKLKLAKVKENSEGLLKQGPSGFLWHLNCLQWRTHFLGKNNSDILTEE